MLTKPSEFLRQCLNDDYLAFIGADVNNYMCGVIEEKSTELGMTYAEYQHMDNMVSKAREYVMRVCGYHTHRAYAADDVKVILGLLRNRPSVYHYDPQWRLRMVRYWTIIIAVLKMWEDE